MARHSLSANEIQLRVGGGPRARWPERTAGVAWEKLHSLVDDLQSKCVQVDASAAALEENRDFSPEGVAKKRATLVAGVLKELTGEYKMLKSALSAIENSERTINERMSGLPKPQESVRAVMLAAEIRAWIAKQRSPIDAVMSRLTDPDILAAVLHSPGYLAGLSDVEMEAIKARARQELHPEGAAELSRLATAREQAQATVKRAVEVLIERGDVSYDAESGTVTPLPHPSPIVGRHSPQATIKGNRIVETVVEGAS